MTLWRLSIVALACCLGGFPLRAGDVTLAAAQSPGNGGVDEYFNTTNGPAVWNDRSAWPGVLSILPFRSGQVLVGGRFMQVEGTNWAHLARLNADGSLDYSYAARPNRPV